jgi:hypothetical protein
VPFLSCPTTRHEGAWGKRRYSSYSYSTSALDGGEWSASRPGRALAPGKGPPVPTVQEAGWAPEPVWTQRLEEKSFAPAGDRTPIARSSSPYPDTILPELTRLLGGGGEKGCVEKLKYRLTAKQTQYYLYENISFYSDAEFVCFCHNTFLRQVSPLTASCFQLSL